MLYYLIKMNDEIIHKKVQMLLNKPVIEQRSIQWFLARKTLITASEVASCLFRNEQACSEYVKTFNIENFKYDNKGCNGFETLEQYIIKKCESYKPFPDTEYTLFGKKHEDSALRFYRLLTGAKVLEFGLLAHYRNKWLANSPDGITTNGIMLEIKVPKSRKLEMGKMPFGYYCQVQIQMECCNLDSCDFLECKITEKAKNDFFDKQEIDMFDGIIVMNKSSGLYFYPDVSIVTKQDFLEWTLKFEQNDHSFIYYRIEQYNLITVARNKVWYNNVKDTLKEIWDKIQKFQKKQELFENFKKDYYYKLHTKHRESYEKTVIEESLMDVDDDLQTMIFEQEPEESIFDTCML
jgi:putative phage-type endonuclease